MATESSERSTNSRLRFSVSQLLVAITALAIPIALLSRYWIIVNNTVDERTLPFAEVGMIVQAYLICGLMLLIIFAIVIFAFLLKRRLHAGAALFALALLLIIIPLVQLLNSKVVDPVRGNETAEIHNDAAAIVAIAIERHYAKSETWPKDWNDLKGEIAGVLSELEERQLSATSDLFAAGNAPFAGASALDEETQSIMSRAPDLSRLAPENFHHLVDVDFAADPSRLAQMNWSEFDGIVPHLPSYNTYRVEFQKLISRLRSRVSASDDKPANSSEP